VMRQAPGSGMSIAVRLFPSGGAVSELRRAEDRPVAVARGEDRFHALHVFIGGTEEAIEYREDDVLGEAVGCADRHGGDRDETAYSLVAIRGKNVRPRPLSKRLSLRSVCVCHSAERTASAPRMTEEMEARSVTSAAMSSMFAPARASVSVWRRDGRDRVAGGC